MNAFSKNYQSVIDWSGVSKDRKISTKVSANRQTRMDSDDPMVRAQAVGDMGPLSARINPAIAFKNSKV